MVETHATLSALIMAIISDQPFVRLGFERMFECRKDIRVVWQSHWRIESGAFLTEMQPDIIILDIETKLDVTVTIHQIHESAPNSKILLLSGLEDGQRMRDAFACGVDGVILKVQPPAVVLAAIDALSVPANRYDFITTQDVRNLDWKALPAQNVDLAREPASEWPDGLTERKLEIIRLVGQGLSNKDIADRLCISDSTVRQHLTDIFDKVGVSNRQKLLIHAQYFFSSVQRKKATVRSGS